MRGTKQHIFTNNHLMLSLLYLLVTSNLIVNSQSECVVILFLPGFMEAGHRKPNGSTYMC